MKTELLNKPAHHFRFDSSGLLLMSLAFLLGVGSYVLIKPSFPEAVNKAYSIVNLDYRVFGCVLLLLLVQLTAFSIIGTVILSVLNFALDDQLFDSQLYHNAGRQAGYLIYRKSFFRCFSAHFFCFGSVVQLMHLCKEAIRQTSHRQEI